MSKRIRKKKHYQRALKHLAEVVADRGDRIGDCPYATFDDGLLVWDEQAKKAFPPHYCSARTTYWNTPNGEEWDSECDGDPAKCWEQYALDATR